MLQDLAKLKDPHIINNLSFQRGLHPFYPAVLHCHFPSACLLAPFQLTDL